MENKKLLEEIRSYWNNRADGYSRVNQEELHSEQKEKWKEVLLEQLPKKEKDQVQILDIGTGPGFFAILLAEEGYQVTAVDYTEQMLQEAKSNAADLADQISFKRMDAQNLEFPKDRDEKCNLESGTSEACIQGVAAGAETRREDPEF